MGTIAEDIDAYFGEDTFDWAADLARRTRVFRKEYDTFVKRHYGAYDDGLWLRLDLLERIAADVDAAFKDVRARRKVDRKQFKAVLELFETASDCVEFELEQLQAMFALGLATALTPFVKQFPFRDLAKELKAYEQALSGLKNALERAKRERNEARIDKAIDIAQGIITFAFPNISLAKEIAIGAAGLFADSRLGPQAPDGSKITRTTATTLKGPLMEITKLTKSMDGLAGVASKFNAVYDILNFEELDMANAAVENAKKAIKEEKETHKRIVANIWAKWRSRVMIFLVALERANKQLEESADRLHEVRSALQEQRDIAGYNPPIVWRIAA